MAKVQRAGAEVGLEPIVVSFDFPHAEGLAVRFESAPRPAHRQLEAQVLAIMRGNQWNPLGILHLCARDSDQ